MPRKSQANLAALQVVSSQQEVEVIRRVRSPPGLSRDEQAEFERIVMVQPAEWFNPGNRSMLVEYCRHVTIATHIADMIKAAISRDADDEDVERLVKLQIAESRIIYQLMTALRLTPQSIAPSAVSRNQLRQTSSPWRGFIEEKISKETDSETEAG